MGFGSDHGSKGERMPRFITLAKLLDDPLAETPDVKERFALVERLLKSVGGTPVESFWTTGAYDIAVRSDGLDSEGAAAFELALRTALPASVLTLPALELDAVARTVETVADEVTKGRPAAGRPAAGRPAAGRPAAGRPAAGRGDGSET
jgi:uncharacterized protein with GYD domain